MRFDQELGISASGLGATEAYPQGYFRWSAPRMVVHVPGAGRTTYQVAWEFYSPVTDQPRIVTITAGERVIGHIVARSGWQRGQFVVPAQAFDSTSSELDFGVNVTPPFVTEDRALGVALRLLSVRQLGTATPPRSVYVVFGLATLLVFALLRLIGVPTRWSGFGSGLLLGLALIVLAFKRVDLLIAMPSVVQALALSLLAMPLCRGWLSLQRVDAIPWARAVLVVAVGCFVVRFAGMQHPQFIQIDHTKRIHHIQAIAAGQRAAVQRELSQQYEWGSAIAVPYSLLSYDIFVPLARWLARPRLLQAVEGVTAALDAAVVVALWVVSRRSRLDAAGSWWAAALFAVMPVGYLYFHDGSYPTIISLWVTVLMLWALAVFVEQPRPWPWVASVAMIALSMLMYVTHLVFVPLLLGCAIVSALVLGDARLRRTALWIALALTTGIGLAVGLYYGQHLPTLIGRTLPEYFATLRSGASVGRDSTLLPGPLLGTTWQQIWGHYRVIGIVVAAVGMLMALRQRSRWSSHLLVGYGAFLVVTMLADLRFGLWNKHMYFALPGVCIAAGAVLGALRRRGWAGAIIGWSLFGWLLWSSVEAWILRVIWYVWSLETL